MATEDFTTFAHVDPSGTVAVTSTTLTGVAVPDTEDNYTYKDGGVDQYVDGLDHLFDFSNDGTGGGKWYPWVVSDALNDAEDLKKVDLDGFACEVSYKAPNVTSKFNNFFDGSKATLANISNNTTYYSQVTWSGTTCTWEIFSDSARTTSVTSGSITVSASETHRYVYGINNTNKNKGVTSDGTVSNLDLQEGGGDTTVSATTDALTLTEYVASITKDVLVSATVVALTLATYTATIDVNADTNISANTHVLTLTEQAASIAVDVGVAANTDVLTLTPNAAQVTKDVEILTSVDALTLVNNAATIVYDVAVQANTNALTLTEYTASIANDTEVAANVDALTLATYTSSIVVGADTNISANIDALTLTSYTANVANDTDIGAAVDALTLATFAAGIANDTEIIAARDALVLVEHTTTVSYDVDVQATTDVLTLTTYPASLLSATEVAANTDVLTLTEYTASVAADSEIQAAVAALSLTNYPATVTIGIDVAAATHALTLIEYAASITQDVEVVTNLDALTLTTYTANVTVQAATWGGDVNASAFFATGGTVTISLYNTVTGDSIGVDDSTCPENGTTGLYIWDSTKITTLPTPYTEYAYIMTNGTTSEGGIISYDDFLIQYIIHENMGI